MGRRSRWYDPDKPVVSRGAERVFRWDSYFHLTLAGLIAIVAVIAFVVSLFT